MSFAKKALLGTATQVCACDASVPTFSSQPSINKTGDCPGGRTWTLSWTLSSTPAWAALEVWRDTAGGTNYSFYKRLAIATASTTCYSFLAGASGNPSFPESPNQSFIVRIVPACSDNGAGPFCRDSNQASDSETIYSCLE